MPGPIDYNKTENIIAPRLWPWTVRWYLLKKSIADAILVASPVLKGKILDVGCGSKPYKKLLSSEDYIGIDIATSTHNSCAFDKVFDGVNIPYEDQFFDNVICTEVLEHAADPVRLMSEIKRVLKPGGHALITVPMVIEHHEIPYDRRRFTVYGLQDLVANDGLDIIWIKSRGNFIAVLVYMLYFSLEQIISKRPFIDIIFYLLFPFTFFLLKADKLIRKNPPTISLGWQMLIKK